MRTSSTTMLVVKTKFEHTGRSDPHHASELSARWLAAECSCYMPLSRPIVFDIIGKDVTSLKARWNITSLAFYFSRKYLFTYASVDYFLSYHSSRGASSSWVIPVEADAKPRQQINVSMVLGEIRS